MVPRARQVIAIVFVIQTILTVVTSGAMAPYTVHVAQDQERIEALLTQSHGGAQPSIRPTVPIAQRCLPWASC